MRISADWASWNIKYTSTSRGACNTWPSVVERGSPPKSDRNPQVVFQPSFVRGKRAVQLKLRECTSKFVSLQKVSV